MFEKIFEIFGWLRIAISPILIGSILGIVAYKTIDNNIVGIAIGLILAIIGAVVGISWANAKWKHGGTMQFISRIQATPDIDGEKFDSKN